MIIFDYIYYRVYYTYKNKWKDSTPGAYATSLVTLLELLYILMLPQFVYELITNNKIGFNKIYIIGAFGLIFFYNLYRYQKKFMFKVLSEKWDDEKAEKRKRHGILTVVMIVFTLGLFLGLATILGAIHQGRMEPIF